MRGQTAERGLKSIVSPPSMWTLNGFGTMLYGRRDHDPEPRSYVRTLFVTALFIPVFAIASYRVLDAPGGGWYFLGKTRISSFAKMWNTFVLVMIAGMIGSAAWQSYLSSPGRVAEQLLVEAHELEVKGEVFAAGKRYSKLLLIGKPEAECAQAVERFTRLVCERGKECNGREQVALLRKSLRHVGGKGPRAEIFGAGMAMVQQQREGGNPSVALELFEVIASKSKEHAADEAFHEEILRECTAASGCEMKHVEALATILEKRGADEELELLLAPHQDKLGSSEAARMLGAIYSTKGDLAKADALLTPYVTGRLAALRQAEERYGAVCEREQKACLLLLRTGKAGRGWYERYDGCKKELQQEMVDEYLSSAIKNSRAVRKAMGQLEKEAKIVPFVMDLAIAKLHLSRGKESEEEQAATLQDAEKLFMAVQGIAGEGEGFKIFLGQVKYWLGKEDEGQQLFDLALEQGKRRPELLLTVGKAMRQIGRTEEGRELAEEAYGKGNADEKEMSARLRAAMYRDVDDRITWLNRVSDGSLYTRASLCSARAAKAESEGRYAQAVREYLSADRLYRSMPPDSTTLNNHALIKRGLFSLTGSANHLDSHISMLEKSESLNPTHSSIKVNLASGYIQRMSSRMLQDKIDYRLLRMYPEFSHISLLFETSSEIDEYIASRSSLDDLKRIVEVGERLQLLAPQSTDGFASILAATYYSEDVGICRRLVAKLKSCPPKQEEAGTEEERARYRVMAVAGNGSRAGLFRKAIEETAKASPEQGGKASPKQDARASPKQDLKASPMTQALLRCKLAELQKSSFVLGGKASVAEALELATQAYEIHPSLYTEITLRDAHLFAALQKLIGTDREADKIWRRCCYQLDVADIPLWMFYIDPALRKKLLADPHFQRAAEIYRGMAQRDPQEQTAQCWLVLSHTQPKLAATVAEALAKNEHDDLQFEACFLLSPYSAPVAASRIWRAEAAGKTAEAKRLLAQARGRGIPL